MLQISRSALICEGKKSRKTTSISGCKIIELRLLFNNHNWPSAEAIRRSGCVDLMTGYFVQVCNYYYVRLSLMVLTVIKEHSNIVSILACVTVIASNTHRHRDWHIEAQSRRLLQCLSEKSTLSSITFTFCTVKFHLILCKSPNNKFFNFRLNVFSDGLLSVMHIGSIYVGRSV